MFEQFTKMPRIIKRLQKSKFKNTLDQYINYLISKSYSDGSIISRLNVLEHFFNWLESKKISPKKQLDESLVNIFINKHIPSCQCSRPAPKCRDILMAALHIFLNMQREYGKITVKSKPASKKDKLINEFNNHLINNCGLSENTRRYHVKNVRVFLDQFFRKKPIRFSYLTPKNVQEFLYSNLEHYRYKRSTFGLFIYSIRSFFKFLKLNGIGNKMLIESLPRIIEWKSGNLPDSLNKDELKKFLRLFDRKTALSKRNYAIVTCIIELGLRANEVAHLKLDAINWRNRTINLPRGKTRQEYVLPMTQPIIDAIIDYLKHGRPETTAREVFVYHHAPTQGKGILPHLVTKIIFKAIRRLGLTPTSAGSNLLRRTFATNLLQKGSSIKEISDLLRHRSIDTTTIYTKVDFHGLTQVPLPWLPKEEI